MTPFGSMPGGIAGLADWVKRMSASMINRIIVGIILAAVVGLVVALGGVVLMAAALLCMAGTMYEMYRAVKRLAPTIQLWPMVFYVIISSVGARFWGILGVVAAFLVAVMVVFAQKILEGKLDFEGILFSVFVLLYPGLFASLLYSLALMPDPICRMGVLMAIFMASMPDMFAYFTGMAFGKHKMAPVISPKKTWEGALGGVLGGLVTGVALYFLQSIFGMAIPLLDFVLLGGICAIAGMIGDLAASLVKRTIDIKDYSRIFMDHGGLMDRLDSVLFVAPVICLYFFLIA